MEFKSQDLPEMKTGERVTETVATGEVAVDLKEEEDAVEEEVIEGEVMIGFQKIRTRLKRYWISSSCNSRPSMEATLRSSSMLRLRNSITNSKSSWLKPRPLKLQRPRKSQRR